jgi:integrase/recombinase XerD
MGLIHTYITEKSTSAKGNKMRTRNVLTKSKHDDNQNSNALFDMRVDTITEGIIPYYAKTLRNLSYENAQTIVNFVMALNSEINPSKNYRKSIVDVFCRLSKHSGKNFNDMTRQDIIDFLDSYRKPEASDPLHKWIGTYNVFRIILIKFFKWFYSPDIESDKRPKPAIVENIPQLKRKEKSVYKPSDMWTAQDDLIFLRYCSSKRMKCYHTMSRDLSARLSEILNLRIKDITWKRIGDKQYAEAVVNGKTGTRSLLVIDSIPYLKEYINSEHPQPTNPNAPLICGLDRSNGRHINEHSLLLIYDGYKKRVFPKLLDNSSVPSEDKLKIRELLKKPWNPYIRRHSAITEKSRILKEHVLRQHCGWTQGSQMHLKYLHYFGNESNESLLEAYGIIDKGIQIDQLRPKQCPNCSEPCMPDGRLCPRCRMVLTYDAYSETIEEKKQKESEVKELKDKYEQDMKAMRQEIREEMKEQLAQLATQLKPEVLKQGFWRF